METLCHMGIVFFAVLGDIGDVGRKISLERDWIVVMCGDKYELTGGVVNGDKIRGRFHERSMTYAQSQDEPLAQI